MSQPLVFDIAVVGAGPAGATAAWLLARQGFQVCLIDKQIFPRTKVCAGLLTWKTTRLIEELFQTNIRQLKNDRVIDHTCGNYRIFYRHTEIARGHLDTPFHFTDRRTYDAYWVTRARAAGANVQAPLKVVRVDHEEGVLDLSDGQRIKAQIIIGADGVWSKVRSALQPVPAARKRWRLDLAGTLETRLPYDGSRRRPSFAALHFGHVPWGYGWSFPGATHQTIGMCFLPRKNNRQIKQSFKAFLALNGLCSDACRPAMHSHPLPYGNYLGCPATKRALLVGDACGLADPLLGEGIYYAHRSAALAAQAITDCAPEWHKAAGLYTEWLHKEILKELRWIRAFRNALFIGGHHRRYRGLKLCLQLFPKPLEAAVQGKRSFRRLWRAPRPSGCLPPFYK